MFKKNMQKLHKVSTVIVLCVVFLFSLQGCSSWFGNSRDDNTDIISADANLRVPKGNIQLEKAKEKEEKDEKERVKKVSSGQNFSTSAQAYQRYKANQSTSLKDFDKTKRYPHLNIKELNEAMDNARKIESKEHSIKVDENSNLKEVINHNKQKKTKKEDSAQAVKAVVPANKAVAKPAPAVKVVTPVNKTATPAPAVKAVSSVNATAATSASAVKTVTSVNKAATPTPAVKVVTPVNKTATPAPAIKAVSSVNKVVSQPVPAVAPAVKSKGVDTQLPPAKVDMGKMTQEDFEKLLKEKFKDEQSTGYIDKLDMQKSATDKGNALNNSIDATNTIGSTDNTSSNTTDSTSSDAASSSTSSSAVSKLINSNGNTKLSRINALLLDCYYSLKNKVSLAFSDN